MSYSIEWTPQARRAAKDIPVNILSGFDQKLLELSQKSNPGERLKKFHTRKGSVLYSVREGEYRLLLMIDSGVMYIFVVGIGPRKTVYRRY